MKRNISLLVISMIILSSACTKNDSFALTESLLSEPDRSIEITDICETDSSFVATETSFALVDSINSLNLDFSFDSYLLDLCEELEVDRSMLEIEDSPYIELSSINFSYAWDYRSFLEEATRPDPSGIIYYYPYISEYHQTRRLMAEDIVINEFEDELWAERNYLDKLDSEINNNYELNDSSYLDGYCFILDDSNPDSRQFYACYLCDNYTIDYVYNLNNGQVSSYSNYLEFCEEFGLPTSELMTMEILGDESS